MSDSDKQAFSQAGLAHILAVSGLHIGVITIILSALLFPIRGPRMNKFKFFTILACIWFYVAFTGLSSSAIRAAIMVSFVYASKIFLRKHSSINALAASAFFILIFSPNAIYDIGFQLSFLSVTGILLWANNLLPRSSNPILNYASSSLSVTLVHNWQPHHLSFTISFIPYKLFHHKLCHSSFAAIDTASECIRDSNSRIGIPTWRIDWSYRLALRVYDSNIPLLYQLPAGGQQHLD